MGVASNDASSSTISCCPLSPPLSYFRHSLRWLILAVSLLAFTLAYGNNISFNFTVICMFRPSGVEATALAHLNQSNQAIDDPKEKFYHDYSTQQRNALFSASALGAICCSMVITQLIGAIGIRAALTLFGLLSGASALLMPLAVQTGFAFIFVLRMVQGSLHPVQCIMVSQLSLDWAPLRTASTYMLILSAQFQLGPVLTMPISGLLCESPWGWPAIYYLQGTLTFLAFGLFFLLYRDTPSQHPCISDKEKNSILRDKVLIQQQQHDERTGRKPKALKVPYRQMFTDPVLWIVLFTYWSDELGFLIFIQYGPIYLNRVLGMDLKKTGFLGALPFLLSIMAKFMMGPINDRLPWKSERVRINIFSAISQIGMIIAFVALTVLPMFGGIPAWLAQVAYTSINVFCGLDFLGVIKCSQRISGHFSPTVMAAESVISAITVLLLPLAVGLVAPNNSVQEWSHLLIGIALFETVTIVLFFAFCDSKPRPWTRIVEPEVDEPQAKISNSSSSTGTQSSGGSEGGGDDDRTADQVSERSLSAAAGGSKKSNNFDAQIRF